MRRLALLPLLASTWQAGCAHGPLACPERGGAAWTETVSTHFTLRSDLGPGAARAALVEFERSWGAFEDLAFTGTRGPSRGRIDLVVFRREEDFRALAPTGAAGYFMPRQAADVDPTPTIAMHGELLPSARRRFQHELTHRFLAARVRRAPPWLEEGLAEYYSTLRLTDDEAIFGEVPVKRVFRTEIHVPIGLTDRWVEQRVALADVPPLHDLVAADGRTFHAPERETAYYAAAWVFVHMLHHGGDAWRARFHALMEALSVGAAPDAAWRIGFGDLPVETLDRTFAAYVSRIELGVRRAPYRSRVVPPPDRQRALSDGEVHLLWGRTRPWDSRENIVAAGGDLERAVAAAPDSPDARYWTALYHAKWRRFAVAEAQLRRAIALAPDEPRAWHALAETLLEAGKRERAAEAVARLSGLARSPWALDFLARWYSDQVGPGAALPFARRAIESGPDCWECQDTWAALRQRVR